MTDDDLTLWMLRLSDEDFAALHEALIEFGTNQFAGAIRAVSAVRKSQPYREGRFRD